MKFSDVVIGGLTIAGGAAIILEARTFPELSGQQYGSSFFPMVVGWAMVLCGSLLAGNSIRNGVGTLVILPPWIFQPRAVINISLVIASLVFYIFASEFIGFDIVSVLIILGLSLWFGVRFWVALIVSLLSTAVFHLVFGTLLRVPLPPGPINGIF